KHNINVLDINQSILGEFFNMIMVVDIENSDIEFEKIAKVLNELADELNVKIQIQHESIFQSMHRI
ncbi:MAG TPA: ACT domain-containing protein, partial [Erysipelothrix sp.]|nr:ACT domain-containing protein [Erysipelothrix sp.]